MSNSRGPGAGERSLDLSPPKGNTNEFVANGITGLPPSVLLFLVSVISHLSKSCTERSVLSNYSRLHFFPPLVLLAVLLIANTSLVCWLLLFCSVLPTAAKAWFAVLGIFSTALFLFPRKRVKYQQCCLTPAVQCCYPK